MKLEDFVDGKREHLWQVDEKLQKGLEEFQALMESGNEQVKSDEALVGFLSDTWRLIKQDRNEFPLLPTSEMRKRIRSIGSVRMSDTAKKQRRSDLFQYGLEIRYQPMFRSIQASPRYVSTDVWLEARDELLFSKVFDRMVELRGQANWSPLLMRPQDEPQIDNRWDLTLKDVKMFATELREERKWKLAVLKQLAEEAFFFLKRQNPVVPITCYIDERQVLQLLQRNDIPVVSAGTFEALDCFEGKVIEEMMMMVMEEPHFLNPDNLTVQAPLQVAEAEEENWSVQEELYLVSRSKEMYFAWKPIAEGLNLSQHGGKPVRTAKSCHARYCFLQSSGIVPEHDKPAQMVVQARQHLERFNLMKSANTKIITKKTLINKKLTLSAHPSHDAAARKANLSITKILTPSEIAMRRMQRQAHMTGNGVNGSSGSGPQPVSVGTPMIPQQQASLAGSPAKGGAPPTRQPAMIPGTPQQQQHGSVARKSMGTLSSTVAQLQQLGQLSQSLNHQSQSHLSQSHQPQSQPHHSQPQKPSHLPQQAQISSQTRPLPTTTANVNLLRGPAGPITPHQAQQQQASMTLQQQQQQQRASLMNRQAAMGLYLQQQQQQQQQQQTQASQQSGQHHQPSPPS